MFLVITGCGNWFGVQGVAVYNCLLVVSVRLLVFCSRLFVDCGICVCLLVVCDNLS